MIKTPGHSRGQFAAGHMAHGGPHRLFAPGPVSDLTVLRPTIPGNRFRPLSANLNATVERLRLRSAQTITRLRKNVVPLKQRRDVIEVPSRHRRIPYRRGQTDA
jgi:hypothetical protein